MRPNWSLVIMLALAGCAVTNLPHVDSGGGQLDFLAGDWVIYDTEGERIGSSRIVVQVPDTMLFELRTVGDKAPQPLWLENAERNGGWTQLFVGPTGQTREFVLQSEPGAWPLVMGADVTLRNGKDVSFRMTITRTANGDSRRLLEISPDKDGRWKTVFDYRYKRS